MIKFLSSWVEQIAIALIIVTIFEMIIPNGNLKKYIKIVLGMYIIFVIISPIVNNKKIDLNNFKIDKYVSNFNNKEATSNYSMDKRLQELYLEELKKNISIQVEQNGYEVSKCKIDADLKPNSSDSGIKKIDLELKKKENQNTEIQNIVIGKNKKVNSSNNNYNNIYSIKEKLATYYQINKDIIVIKIR